MPGDSEQYIHLSKPPAGEFHKETMEPGGRHVLDFYPENANFENAGPDLRLTFDDGAVLLLENFYPALEQADFLLELPDGAGLSGRDVEEALTLALQNFHTDSGNREADETGSPPEGGALPPFSDEGEHGPLLCHELCGLFNEAHGLLEEHDPLFTPRLPSLSQPATPPTVPGGQPGDNGPLAPCDSHSGDILRLDDLLDPVKSDIASGISEAPNFSQLGFPGSGRSAAGPIAPGPGAPAPGPGVPASGPSGFDGGTGAPESPENDWLIAFLRLGGL